jgi:tetratricopeptide (TPR) repeat protein
MGGATLKGQSLPHSLREQPMGSMNRFAILTAVLLILAGSTAFVTASGTFRGADDDLSPRIATVESPTDRAISQLQQLLAEAPHDAQSLNDLGFAYLQKARESGDPTFYGKADGVFQKALTIDASDQSALIGASSVAAARHDFTQALTFAQRAQELDPDDPDANGALGDALIELGRYDEALTAFQVMLDARPDLNAYVRTAYARELHGDPEGAIEAMHMALEASRPTGETSAWVRSQLGNLYFNSGDFTGASEQYEASLSAFPGYIHALAGLARVAAALEEYERAIELYSEVVSRRPVLEYVAALGDVYRAAGREADAQRQYDLASAIDSLYRANGINTDLEMSLFLTDHDLRPNESLAQARAIYALQPGSVRAADALSWALSKAGLYDEATVYSREALRLGTKDPLLLFHAGMISHRAGDHEAAREHLSLLIDRNPRFSVLHAGETAGVLAELNAAVRERR